MTTPARVERDLPTILGDLAMGPTPEYLDDVFAQTGRMRQRPAWTFPERWIPMADITQERAYTPRAPWRTIAVALVLIALIIGAAIMYVGSHQTKLPPPFGPAKNGVVTYAANGDIFTVDPSSKAVVAVVGGPEIDARPLFSHDGTRIAFLRRHDIGGQTAFDVVVTAADGSGPRVVTTRPIDVNDVVQWSPDGTFLLVATADGEVTKYALDGGATPQILTQGRVVAGAIRPTTGQILYDPDSTPDADLWIMDPDGTGGRALTPATSLAGGRYDLGLVKWSPDGAMIAFTCARASAPNGSHICVMNADGTGAGPLTTESDDWFETDFVWSPDSTRIAFNRWLQDPATGDTTVQPIGVASIKGGPVIGAGPAPAPEGALFDWSPDGTTLLSLPARFSESTDPAAVAATPVAIDVANGTAQETGYQVSSDVSWQRLAN